MGQFACYWVPEGDQITVLRRERPLLNEGHNSLAEALCVCVCVCV